MSGVNQLHDLLQRIRQLKRAGLGPNQAILELIGQRRPRRSGFQAPVIEEAAVASLWLRGDAASVSQLASVPIETPNAGTENLWFALVYAEYFLDETPIISVDGAVDIISFDDVPDPEESYCWRWGLFQFSSAPSGSVDVDFGDTPNVGQIRIFEIEDTEGLSVIQQHDTFEYSGVAFHLELPSPPTNPTFVFRTSMTSTNQDADWDLAGDSTLETSNGFQSASEQTYDESAIGSDSEPIVGGILEIG